MLRIGVLGAGGHSQREHGPALEHCRDDDESLELAAVCDRESAKAEDYADRFGFAAAHESLDRMLETEDLDAVVAVTPVEHTRELAGGLLERGVPTLVEKPPGATPAEGRELCEIADRTDTPHAVSLNRRFSPAVARARQWLADGGRESPTLAVSELLRVGRFEPAFCRNTGIHAVDTVCSFLGAPERVTADRWQSRPGGESVQRGGESGQRGGECAAARAAFPDASAQFSLVPDAGRHAETCTLYGPGYELCIDVAGGRVSLSESDETVREWELSTDAPQYVRSGTLGETRAFLDAVRDRAARNSTEGDGEGFGPTLPEAVRSQALATAIDAGGERSFE